MNVFEKSKLHADRTGYLKKKKATLHYSILKLCSVLSTSNHATVSSKDQNDFYKGIELNILHSLNHRCIVHPIPPTQVCVTRLKHPLLPSTTPQARSPWIALPITLSIKPSEPHLLGKHVSTEYSSLFQNIQVQSHAVFNPILSEASELLLHMARKFQA